MLLGYIYRFLFRLYAQNLVLIIYGVSELNLHADIKGFLTDVKPALLSALEVEYEKNPFEVKY